MRQNPSRRMVRQGDVLVVDVEAAEDGKPVPTEGGRVVLAHGEATGHAHALQPNGVALLEAPSGRRFLKVAEPVPLTHEEHAPIIIAPGLKEVIRQEEYSGEDEWRRVAD